MTSKKRTITAACLSAWLMTVLFLWAPDTSACVICVPYPKSTHADQLLESEIIVAARENPDKPYSFRSVEILKGSIADASSDIDVFLNTITRKKLDLNSRHVVILSRLNSQSQWQWLSYANEEYQAFIKQVLDLGAGWQSTEGKTSRISFFSGHLTHNNRKIREQSYLEVGRASYDRIKSAAESVPREQIRLFLSDWRLVEWHSLYILMLGQSRHPEDIAYIKDHFNRSARFQSRTNLSAWATAFAETHPDTGIDTIEELYFANGSRDEKELIQVLTALSVLGTETGEDDHSRADILRHQIVNSYATLLENYPGMAGWVAKDLTIWKRKALVSRLSEIIENKLLTEPASIFSVKFYLSQAPRFSPFRGDISHSES